MFFKICHLIYVINCLLLYAKVAKVEISNTNTYKKLAKNPNCIWLGLVKVPLQKMGSNIFNASIIIFFIECYIYYQILSRNNFIDTFLFYSYITISFFSKYYETNLLKSKSQSSLAYYYVNKLVKGEKILIVGGGPATNILTLLQDMNKILKKKFQHELFKCSISKFKSKITIFAQQFTMYPELNLTGQQVNTSCDERSAFELVKFIKEYDLNAIFIGTSANKWKDKSLNVRKVTDWSKVNNSYHKNIITKQFEFTGTKYATSGIMFDPVTYLFAINYMGINTNFLPKTHNVFAFEDIDGKVRISKDKLDNSFEITMMKPLWEQSDDIIDIMTDRKENNDFEILDLKKRGNNLEDLIVDLINGKYKLNNDINVLTIGDGITGDLDDIIMYLCANGTSENPIGIIYTTAPSDPHQQTEFKPKTQKLKDYLTYYVNDKSIALGKLRGYCLEKELFYLFDNEVNKKKIFIAEGKKQANKHPFGGLSSFHCEKRITTDIERLLFSFLKEKSN